MGNLKKSSQQPVNNEEDPLTICIAFSIPIIILLFIYASITVPTQTLEFQIKSISTTPINASASQITADWNITFSLRKGPNLTSIYYDIIEASIYYKDVLLSKSAMDSIYLSDVGVWIPATANLSARSVSVEKWTGDAIAADWNRKAAVRFNVKVEVRVLLDPGTKSRRNGNVSVYCEDVKAIESDEDVIIKGKWTNCNVELTEDNLVFFTQQ